MTLNSGDSATNNRVLLVEDDFLIALEAEASLEEAGFPIVAAVTTAADAIVAARTHRPALIVMDIRLAGDRDGVDAALEIYRETGIRCIFASAHNDPDVRRRAEAARPLGWLAKPYLGTTLVRMVEDGIGCARPDE